jgi:class 3 adenylate cyclase
VAIPICQDGRPLAILSATAREGQAFSALELAGNVLLNARRHWKMEQEKWTLDRNPGHLRPFVPETVQRIVEKNPEAPQLEKRDLDVSILFLDVAGYTRISQTLTREQVNFIMEKYFSSFLDVIYAQGGDINATAGDGLMVIFQGAATAHALHAARAALTIRTRTGELNHELDGRFMPLRVNMGINSGTAALGMSQFHGTAGTRMTFTASGPVTNLASWIAAAATDGDILVGPETARRIAPASPCYDRGIMDFKNVLEGVRISSLVPPG